MIEALKNREKHRQFQEKIRNLIPRGNGINNYGWEVGFPFV